MPGIFNSLLMKNRRTHLRNHSTRQEKILWNYLQKKQIIGNRFHRQYGIGPYIADFYAPSIRLCIECDGYHHKETLNQEYDTQRGDYMAYLRILRFSNTEIDEDIEKVVEKIKRFAENRTPVRSL